MLKMSTVMALLLVLTVRPPSTVFEREQARQHATPVEVVRRHYELMNAGDWKHAADLFAPDVRHHLGNWREEGEAIVHGKQALTENLEDIFTTFPDWKMEIVGIVSEGESVVVRCRVSGTHRGVATKRVNGGYLVGVPPTGRHFQVQHIHWYNVHDGKITDHFANRDDLGMTQQLGVLAPPRR